MKAEHVKQGVTAVALSAVIAVGGAIVGKNISDQNYSATATAEVAEWTQWAVDAQATEDAIATEDAQAAETADAQAAQYAADATATEEAFWVQDATAQAAAATESAEDEANALASATVELAMTLTQDVFFNATQYARIAHKERGVDNGN